MIANPKKGKAEGCSPRLFSKDQSREALIPSNHTQVNSTSPDLAIIYVQMAQFELAELAMLTDNPPMGLVEAADALDEAEWYLARGLV